MRRELTSAVGDVLSTLCDVLSDRSAAAGGGVSMAFCRSHADSVDNRKASRQRREIFLDMCVALTVVAALVGDLYHSAEHIVF